MTKQKFYIRPAFLSVEKYAWCGLHGESWLRGNKGEKRGCSVCCSKTMEVVKEVYEIVTKRKANVCVLGHGHDSAGEAASCPFVYEEAKKAGLRVYQPGKPGIPCFSLDPDPSTGRPVYVSVDWLLLGADRKPVLALDYKGRVAKSKRRDKGWARGKRILETELGIRVIELKDWTEIGAAIAALNQSARAEGG